MEGEWLVLLQQLLTNPNVAYVLLIVGLWAMVAAWTIPGTGFPEAAAVICLLLAGLGLVQLPVNLIGLALVLASVGLFILDLQVQSAGLTLGAGAGLALGSLILFRHDTGATVSRWLVGGATLGSLSFFGLALSAAMRAQRLPVKMDPGLLVGVVGVAKTDLEPSGTALVQGELWTVVADVVLPAGTPVRVVAVEGIRLRVVSAKSDPADMET